MLLPHGPTVTLWGHTLGPWQKVNERLESQGGLTKVAGLTSSAVTTTELWTGGQKIHQKCLSLGPPLH